MSLLVVSVHNPNVVLLCDLISPLLSLLEPLDRFNQLAPGADREDTEDMAWPGIIGLLIIFFGIFRSTIVVFVKFI